MIFDFDVINATHGTEKRESAPMRAPCRRYREDADPRRDVERHAPAGGDILCLTHYRSRVSRTVSENVLISFFFLLFENEPQGTFFFSLTPHVFERGCEHCGSGRTVVCVLRGTGLVIVDVLDGDVEALFSTHRCVGRAPTRLALPIFETPHKCQQRRVIYRKDRTFFVVKMVSSFSASSDIKKKK